MDNAGMLTYILPQTPHFFAVLVFRLRWVCLCLKYFYGEPDNHENIQIFYYVMQRYLLLAREQPYCPFYN